MHPHQILNPRYKKVQAQEESVAKSSEAKAFVNDSVLISAKAKKFSYNYNHLLKTFTSKAYM